MNQAVASLLDGTLDDIADLPEFKVFPPGSHQVSLSFKEKAIGDHPAVELKLKHVQTLELSNTEDIAPQPGDETGVAFMLDNEFGAGKFKEVLKVLAAHFGTNNTRELLEKGEGLEVVVTTKVRVDGKDKDKKYTDIHKMAVL